MSTKQLGRFETEVEIPEDVQVTYKSNMLEVSGPLGKTHKITPSEAKDYLTKEFGVNVR